MASTRERLVVIGNGMVGHRFLERLTACSRAGELAHHGRSARSRGLAYDRVNLSKFFDGDRRG